MNFGFAEFQNSLKNVSRTGKADLSMSGSGKALPDDEAGFAARLDILMAKEESQGSTESLTEKALSRLKGSEDSDPGLKAVLTKGAEIGSPDSGLKEILAKAAASGSADPGLKEVLAKAAASGGVDPDLKAALLKGAEIGSADPGLKEVLAKVVESGGVDPDLKVALLKGVETSSDGTRPNKTLGFGAEAHSGNSVMNRIVSRQDDSPPISTAMGNLFSSLTRDLEKGDAVGFLDKFRQFLDMAGNDTDKMIIKSRGASALEELFVQAGFPKEQVADLIADLQAESSDGEIPVFDFLSGLSEMELQNGDDSGPENGDTLLAVSDLPFIETVMTALGVPKNISEKIISDATVKNRGISLDRLVQGLQSLEKAAFINGADFRTDPQQQKGLESVLSSLGMDRTGSGQKPLTLEEFTAGLEKMGRVNNPAPEGQAPAKDGGTGEESSKQTLLDSVLSSIEKGSSSSGLQGELQAREQKNSIALDFQKIKSEKQISLGDFLSKQDDQKILEKSFSGREGGFEKELAALLSKAELAPGDRQKNTVSSDPGKGGEALLAGGNKKTEIKGLDTGQPAGGDSRGGDMNRNGAEMVKAKPQSRTLPSYVTHQVGKNLARAVNRGDNELRLQLKPPELGRIIMKIENLGDSLKVSVVTENHSAKEILSMHTNDLKSTLSQSGVHLKSFDVEMGSDFQQSMADARQQPGNNGSNRGRKRNFGLQQGTAGQEDSPAIERHGNQEGELHFVA
ncbi:MAG TPA: flagellar hook-length control protein FliK [Desulfobacteraceae bacterium]|nr:flagellar hook-length control protein FliK [Desulfobacteraceae bacterium]